MKKLFKKHKQKYIIMIVIAIINLIVFVLSWPKNNDTSQITLEQFSESVEIIQEDAKVGADIWLKQTIHGTDGIHYRYIIETDCPEWDFETRYMSDEPIDWVDDTSAVEVLIKDMRINYNDTVYASGQYYTVPILGGISSETVSFEEWTDTLVKQAYQVYVSDIEPSIMFIISLCVLIIMIVDIITDLCKFYEK